MVKGQSYLRHFSIASKAFASVASFDKKGTSSHVQNKLATYASLLRNSGEKNALAEGQLLHAYILKDGFYQELFLCNLLIEMYAKCEALEDACKVFNTNKKHNIFSWTLMLSGYVRTGFRSAAIRLFEQMWLEGVRADKVVFILILDACCGSKSLALGTLIHAYVLFSQLEPDVILANALAKMYANCGSLIAAQETLSRMSQLNVISWTTLIAAYALHEYGKDALRIFWSMQSEGSKPNRITFIEAVDACSSLSQGKLIHAHFGGIAELDVLMGSSLINMYGKCGSLEDARTVFDLMPQKNVVSWTAMISACSELGSRAMALENFQELLLSGLKLDKVIFIAMLNSCFLSEAPEGRFIHAHVINYKFDSDLIIGNALVSMYCKTRSFLSAHRVFINMDQHDIISWNLMITSYVQSGHHKEALKLFRQMQSKDIRPDKFTYIAILEACAGLGDLIEGRLMYNYIVDKGFEVDVMLGNALVYMYARCGDIKKACDIFYAMSSKDLVSWNIMNAAYAQHGHVEDATNIFWQMQHEGLWPDKVSFLNILSACSLVGYADVGWHYFCFMDNCFGITPEAAHYGCMIDLFARNGQLEEAVGLIQLLPAHSAAVAWTTLLGAYHIPCLGSTACENYSIW